MNGNAWKKRYKRGYPSVKDCQFVRHIVGNIKDLLLPQLSRFFQDFEVHFVKKVRHNWVGVYIQGSYEKPIVLLDMVHINDVCRIWDVPRDYAVETTIVHELGHAIEDWYEVCPSEQEVEEFARQWYDSMNLYEFWDGFEAPEIFNEERKVVLEK
jgi:hypothetical protein